MRYSEALDPESDWFEPDLAPVEYDDEAFRDILAEMCWDEGETDDIGGSSFGKGLRA